MSGVHVYPVMLKELKKKSLQALKRILVSNYLLLAHKSIVTLFFKSDILL